MLLYVIFTILMGWGKSENQKLRFDGSSFLSSVGWIVSGNELTDICKILYIHISLI
jgi:hypothetical protein